MLGGSSEMVVKTVGFLQVGKYDPLPPGNFATVPKARAKQLIATGQVVEAVHAAPEGSRLARYTESDFAWSPNAKPAPEAPLQVADIRHRFTWSQEQWETAIGLLLCPPIARSSSPRVVRGRRRRYSSGLSDRSKSGARASRV